MSSDCCAQGWECDKLSVQGGGREPGKNISAASDNKQAAKSMRTTGCVLVSGSPRRKSGQNRKKEGKKTLPRKAKARESSL